MTGALAVICRMRMTCFISEERVKAVSNLENCKLYSRHFFQNTQLSNLVMFPNCHQNQKQEAQNAYSEPLNFWSFIFQFSPLLNITHDRGQLLSRRQERKANKILHTRVNLK